MIFVRCFFKRFIFGSLEDLAISESYFLWTSFSFKHVYSLRHILFFIKMVKWGFLRSKLQFDVFFHLINQSDISMDQIKDIYLFHGSIGLSNKSCIEPWKTACVYFCGKESLFSALFSGHIPEKHAREWLHVLWQDLRKHLESLYSHHEGPQMWGCRSRASLFWRKLNPTKTLLFWGHLAMVPSIATTVIIKVSGAWCMLGSGDPWWSGHPSH